MVGLESEFKLGEPLFNEALLDKVCLNELLQTDSAAVVNVNLLEYLLGNLRARPKDPLELIKGDQPIAAHVDPRELRAQLVQNALILSLFAQLSLVHVDVRFLVEHQAIGVVWEVLLPTLKRGRRCLPGEACQGTQDARGLYEINVFDLRRKGDWPRLSGRWLVPAVLANLLFISFKLIIRIRINI